MPNRQRGDVGLDASPNLLDMLAARVIQHDRELFTAIAGRYVQRPVGAACETPSYLPQAFIARLVAVVVVVSLEVIDIDQDQGQRHPVADGLRPDAVDVVVEHPAVVDAGEAVTAGSFDQQNRKSGNPLRSCRACADSGKPSAGICLAVLTEE
jgi:hypothetical protein